MPDGIATYQWRGQTFTGDGQRRRLPRGQRRPFRGQRVWRASPAGPLPRLQSGLLTGNLYAAGARSFSIRDADGNVVYDSGSILDREAHARGIYDDGRSRDKGVEPEGVTLLESAGAPTPSSGWSG